MTPYIEIDPNTVKVFNRPRPVQCPKRGRFVKIKQSGSGYDCNRRGQ